MNVLIFVTTMLMLLSVMTYARFESYRNSHAFQLIFKDYMEEKERGEINKQADRVYRDIKVKEKEEGKEGQKKNSRIDASPRIAIGLLFDRSRDNQQKDWEQTKILLKNLIITLYEHQPFYQKIEAGRAGFVDDLIASITQEIDKLPKEKELKKTGDLANLLLPDPVLNELLYKILHGAFYMDDPHKLVEQVDPLTGDAIAEEEIPTTDNEVEPGKNTEEFKSPQGYYSLLDYVTGRKKQKIRVYLAPRNVLLAVFKKDAGVVDNIIDERERLFHLADNADQMEHLNETFKSQFESRRDSAIDEESLNFSVSKTNPKYYR
jgi:hypothetical protein